MLRPRIIPCLLVEENGLVKTVNFKNPKYIGDPINTVRIFNEKEVDELIILDIRATIEDKEPNFKMIENCAKECRMPLCYGGGIKSVEQAIRIFSVGVEKIALSSSAIINPSLIKEISQTIGSQSLVVVVDVKKNIFGDYQIFIHNGKKHIKKDLISFIKEAEIMGAGEIIINNIDLDGTMKGYDFALIEKIRNKINLPITVLGGAGEISHIEELIKKFKIIGASAGSIFVFKGKYKAVLINYPSKEIKDNLSHINLYK